MMITKELRIGNLVLLDNPIHHPNKTGKIHVVVSVSDDRAELITLDEIPNTLSFGQLEKFIKPIHPTPELLGKLGFGLVPSSNQGAANSYVIGINDVTHDYLFEIKDLFPEAPGLKMFYRNGKHNLVSIHQIQNLYQALTLNELSIEKFYNYGNMIEN